MNDESGRRRPLPRSLWLMALLWLAATAGAVIWGIPHFEDDLRDRARQALETQPVTVEIEGRDALISGDVPTAADLDWAVATARQVRGVRRVDSEDVGVVVDDLPLDSGAEMDDPTLTITIDDGAVVLSGTVADRAAADAIVSSAQARWGTDNVVDQLVVGPNTSGAAWLAGIARAIAGVDDFGSGSILVSPAGVRIAGAVPSEEARVTIEQGLAAAFGEAISIDNQLQVVDLTDPSFEAELLDDGIIRLRGVLDGQSTVDAIVAGAAGEYGSARISNEMAVGTSIASPDYLAAIPSIFSAIDGLNPWRLNVDADGATITGLAVSETAIEGTLGRLTSALSATGISLESQLEVDPGAVATVLTELLQGTATFEVGSAQLSEEAAGLLDSAIEILQDNPTTVLTVEGHTDDVGSDADNRLLSEERAQAVVDYLVAGGVDPARLSAVGYGEAQPIADNETAEGRAQNRRIQFVVEQGDN